MKKILFTLVTLFTFTMGTKAMSYEQAREEALFLSDKMAYELNLSPEQYEAVYEINLDYLMGVTTASDLYSVGWRQRNLDLQYMLLDWQYTAFCAASYFYRPVAWVSGGWYFGIYRTYPTRTYFYFDRPACYITYRGGHSWRSGRSWYVDNRICYRDRGIRVHSGMRDTWRGGAGRGVAVGRSVVRTDHRGVSVNHGGASVNHRNGVNYGTNYRGEGNREHSVTDRSHSNSTYDRGNRGVYDRGNDASNQRRGFSRGESSTRSTVSHGSMRDARGSVGGASHNTVTRSAGSFGGRSGGFGHDGGNHGNHGNANGPRGGRR